jgi:hypothetical protein
MTPFFFGIASVRAGNYVQHRKCLIVAVGKLGGVLVGDYRADGDYSAEVRRAQFADWFHLSGGNVQPLNFYRDSPGWKT